jgi:hypothetical protein
MSDAGGAGSAIGLVHLVWAPLGAAPVRGFLSSYDARRAGAAHELIVLYNGEAVAGSTGISREALARELGDRSHRLIVLDRPLVDLAAYGEAARLLEHPRLCFVNSYGVVLADDWLGHLSRALEEPDVGLAGATGSWESQAEWLRGRARYWPYQLAGLVRARRRFPRFPNPHIRSTAFMIPRRAILEIGLDRVRDKHDAYLLESGPASITRRVQEAGRRVVVVGRDARAYDVPDWPRSRTYRAGEQDNLLVADNRTDDWHRASPRLRRRLTLDAWGKHGHATAGS